MSDSEDKNMEDAQSFSSDSESDQEQNNNNDKSQSSNNPTPTTFEKCSFDVRNLIALNGHEVDFNALYTHTPDPQSGDSGEVNEDYILQKSAEGCQQLISEIWDLPKEIVAEAGPIVTLPGNFEIVTPRELPPPEPRKETKWEKFAKERGMGPKGKRDRKVFDEGTGEWAFRHGYQKANSKDVEWPIMEVKRNDNPFADPWEKARDAKRARVDKNLGNRMRNEESMGLLPRGSANKMLKDKESAREKGKEGHRKGNVMPSAGLPVDLKTGKATGDLKPMKRGKELTMAALTYTQRSTASMGKFDKMREGEHDRKAAIRRRKFDSATDKKAINSESERGMKVLQNVISGATKKAEKARRDGSLAKGETAYDYDYNDGLGPSSFKKKKGRAGAGKMRKITKKRAQ